MTVSNIFLQRNSVTSILIENAKGDPGNYRTLCALFTNSSVIPDENLLSILSQLRECIGLLNQETRSLVQIILNIDWTKLSDPVLKEHAQLLVSLAVGQVCYLEQVLKCVVKKFIPNLPPPLMTETLENLDKIQSPKLHRVYAEGHLVIQCILRISPMCRDKLFNILAEGFPFMRRPAFAIRDYIRNLLRLSINEPTLRIDILRLIVEDILKIDTVCSKETSQEFNDSKLNESDAMFSMDCDLNDETSSKNKQKLIELNSKLDIFMNDLFEYISNRSKDQQGTIIGDVVEVYQDFFEIFERIVLPVFSCNSVQFVWLYLCSLQTQLRDHFLSYLWQKVQDPSTDGVLRQSAACYLSGFLARAEYVDIKTCKTFLNDCGRWLHSYVNNEDSTKRDCSSLHGTFYAVCQSVFYVITFRHKELLESKKGHNYLKKLNLDRLITSNLNPLKFCLDTVVANFASVSRNYQFAFCYTVMERNRRVAIYDDFLNYGSSTLTSTSAAKKRLNCFFPFDPYGLEKSSAFIAPIYRRYVEDEYNSVEASKNCRQTSSGDTEDDFLTDDIMMSTSVENRTKNILMSYSISPGYKHL